MQDTNMLNDVKTLTAIVDAAWNAGDGAAFAACWTEDGTVMSPMGELSAGRQAIEQGTGADLAGFMKGSKHELNVDQVYELAPNVVLAEGEAVLSNVTGPDGTAFPAWKAHFVATCVQQDGKWLLSHMRSYVLQPKA